MTMSWDSFIYFALASVLLWAVGAWGAWREKRGVAYTTTVLGLAVFFTHRLPVQLQQRILESLPLPQLLYGLRLAVEVI